MSKDSFLFEAKLHILQANGFSPVCVKIWRDIQEGCFMTFWHTGHWYCPSSRMMGTIICNNISNILNLFFKNKKLLRLIAHNKGVKKDLVHCFSLFPNNEHFGHVSSTFLSYLRHNHNNHKPRAFLQCEAGYDGLPCICLSLFSDIKDIVLAHPQELLV